MTFKAFVDRLEGVRSHMALCPAHEDREPSLSVGPGDDGILVHCFAGCTPEEICRALGFTLRDLFYDSDDCPKGVRHASRKARPITWRQFAGQLEDEALGLWLRGTAVRSAARSLDATRWTDEELEGAMEAVTSGRVDLELAEIYSDLAFNLRRGGLRKEEADACRRQQA